MTKQATIQQLAKKWFDRDSLEIQRNSNDFAETAVWCIQAALEAAYEAGAVAAQVPRTAPAQPLQATRFIEGANTTVTVVDGLSIDLVVKITDHLVQEYHPQGQGTESQGFTKFQAEDMEFLSKSFAHLRVDVFMAVVELLGEVSRQM